VALRPTVRPRISASCVEPCVDVRSRSYVVKDRKDDTLGYSHTLRNLYSHGEFLGSAILNVHDVNEVGPTAFDVETVSKNCIKA